MKRKIEADFDQWQRIQTRANVPMMKDVQTLSRVE